MSRIAVLVFGGLERPGRSSEDLERDVERVMDILEADTGAIGPAVGCDFERSVIDVRFSVEAEDSAAIHRSIGNITETIDSALDGRITTAMQPSDSHEFACA